MEYRACIYYDARSDINIIGRCHDNLKSAINDLYTLGILITSVQGNTNPEYLILDNNIEVIKFNNLKDITRFF